MPTDISSIRITAAEVAESLASPPDTVKTSDVSSRLGFYFSPPPEFEAAVLARYEAVISNRVRD